MQASALGRGSCVEADRHSRHGPDFAHGPQTWSDLAEARSSARSFHLQHVALVRLPIRVVLKIMGPFWL